MRDAFLFGKCPRLQPPPTPRNRPETCFFGQIKMSWVPCSLLFGAKMTLGIKVQRCSVLQ